MTTPTKQLVDQANEAFRAFQDIHEAYNRAVGEDEGLTKKMADLIAGKTEGTLGDLQTLWKQNEAHCTHTKQLSGKTFHAQQAACAAYEIAVEALAKEAGLTDGMQPNAGLRRSRSEWQTEDKQMVGQAQDQMVQDDPYIKT